MFPFNGKLSIEQFIKNVTLHVFQVLWYKCSFMACNMAGKIKGLLFLCLLMYVPCSKNDCIFQERKGICHTTPLGCSTASCINSFHFLLCNNQILSYCFSCCLFSYALPPPFFFLHGILSCYHLNWERMPPWQTSWMIIIIF